MNTATRLNRKELSQLQDSQRKVILVVEDDVTLQPVLRRMFRKLSPDATIEWATDVNNALALIESRSEQDYDLILADVFLDGDRSGLDLVRECRAKKLETSCVVTSGGGEGVLAGAKYPFLPKPFDFDTFRRCVGPYLAEAPPLETLKHRKNWFWPITMGLVAMSFGAGVSQLAIRPVEEVAPVILDYDITRGARWATLGYDLFDSRNEMNQLIWDPYMIPKMERSQRASMTRLFAVSERITWTEKPSAIPSARL